MSKQGGKVSHTTLGFAENNKIIIFKSLYSLRILIIYNLRNGRRILNIVFQENTKIELFVILELNYG